MMNKLFLAFIFCFFAAQVNGQKYKASVQNIDSAGFYKISLQPALVAKSESNLNDLRLLDEKGHEIPYVTSADMPAVRNDRFIVFPKIENTRSGFETAIVVENKATNPINRLWIRLKNTEVLRTMNLAGSDDQEHWYAIEENIVLETPDTTTGGEYVQSIHFAASNYKYFRLNVNDKKKTPIKFVQAGIYISASFDNKYQAIVPVKLVQKDSAKVSFVKILLNENYQVNKIHLFIKGPKYFKRQVSIYDNEGKEPELLGATELNSASSNDLFFNAKTRKLLLEIENADNLPLVISEATVYQNEEYIVSYLEKGAYFFTIGAKNASIPNYDLKFFKDSLKGNISTTKHLDVQKNSTTSHAEVKPKKEYTALIWVAIVIALLLLSLLTWKMIKEVNDNKPSA